MLTSWESTPFRMAPGSLCLSDIETELPFSIGSITRQGFDHIRLGISNQDHICIKISENLIVGILCDGCTTNSEEHVSDFSSNEFGAKVLSEIISNLCFQNIKPRKNKMNLENFMQWLNKQTIKNMDTILSGLGLKNETQRERFQFQNMTSTIIGFIIREKEYFLFHCGDGVVKVNNQLYELSNDAGTYFGITKKAKLKLFHSGHTKDLQRLMVASDGFDNVPFLKSDWFEKFYKSENNLNIGYSDLIPEFHINVLNEFYAKHQIIKKWPKDDASMILLRRIIKE